MTTSVAEIVETTPTNVSNVPPKPAYDVNAMRPVELPKNIQFLDVEDIVMDEALQVRRYSPPQSAIVELAKDIATNGQLQPVLIRKIKGKSVLVAGFTRTLAIDYANKHKLKDEPIKVAAMLVDMGNLEAFSAGVRENLKRNQMSPIDYAYICKTMLDEYGIKKIDIGKAMGRVPSWVTEHLQLAELRPAIQKRVHSGELPYTTCRELFGLTEGEQDEHLKSLNGAGKNSREKVRNAKAKKGQSKKAKKRATASNASVSMSSRELRAAYMDLAGEGLEEGQTCKHSKKVQVIGALLLKHLNGKMSTKALASKLA